MPEQFFNGAVVLHAGDSRDVIKTLAESSIDAVVTDPPYALVSIAKRFGKENSATVIVPEGGSGAYARASKGFMGKQWDTGETAFDPAFWKEVLRVLKPGGHIVAFSGTRTYHRMTCAIEDAGLEIRDSILEMVSTDRNAEQFLNSLNDEQRSAFSALLDDTKFTGLLGWAYGSGFPKSHNAGSGWGTALKPAWEPICLARKPLIGTVAVNKEVHGTGAINVDGCRVEHITVQNGNLAANPHLRDDHKSHSHFMQSDGGRKNFEPSANGRWPANIVHDGSPEVILAFPDNLSSGTGAVKKATGKGTQANAYGKESRAIGTPNVEYGDIGSAARFFYTAKADAEDRFGSKHPTVKPVDLMQWLVRLVTPPGGVVLDPFAGTGTTGEAAIREGMNCILVEREVEYLKDIRVRMEHALAGPVARKHARMKNSGKTESMDATPLFGGAA